jgi:hypothetical protein
MLTAEDGSQCRWVIPQMSLSRKFFPDFLVGRLDSTGLNWTLIESIPPQRGYGTSLCSPPYAPL